MAESQEKDFSRHRRVEDSHRSHVETPQGLSGMLEVVPARVRALLLMAMIGIGGGGATVALEACSGSEVVDTATDPILLTRREEPWNFKMYQTGRTKVTDQYGTTLYHFIKGYLAEKKLVPEGMSEENLINAIIYFCRKLNTQNLDNFTSIKDEKIYFPEFLYAERNDGKDHVIRLGMETTPDKDEELVKTVGRGTEISELNGKLDHLLEQVAQDYKRNPNENAWPEMQAFDALMQRTNTSSYHEIMWHYNIASRSEMNSHMGKSAFQIQDEIERLGREEGGGKEKNKEKIEKLTRILKTKIYEEFFAIAKKLNPNQVESKKLFRGTVLDSRVAFYELETVWRYKKDKKGQSKDFPAYDIAIDELADRNNTVTLESWLPNQEAACAYFQKHGAELGYNSELAKYMTPSVILSVVHAEFFSELSGRAYLDLLPIAIESANLVYGPAVGDTEFSAGVVQMIRSTFEGILDSKGSALRTLQGSDSSFVISVPQKVEKTVKKGRKTEKIKVYENKDIVNAMITDLPSHSFYAILAVADHIELGFNELMEDPQFKKAWDEAPESERYLFIASFSASAINNGRGGVEHKNGAYGAAYYLLEKVDSDSLTAYITSIPTAAAESVPITKPGKKETVKRGARVGLETMREMLIRAQALEREEPEQESEALKQVPLLTEYGPMRDRAIADGFPLSLDKAKNRKIYEATLSNPNTVELPTNHEFFFRKPNPDSIARMENDAYAIFLLFAKDFKNRTGYTLSYTDVLRTPEYQDKMSPIDDSTHYTGRTIDIPDGRFKDSKGKEITWSVPTGKKDKKGNPTYKRGPHADEIEEKLRPALVQLMEEYQGKGYMMVFPEVEGGGHWHLYVPKTVQGGSDEL